MDLTIFLTNLAEWLGVFAVAWLLSLAPQFRSSVVGFRYARRDGLAALFLGAGALIFAVAFSSVGVGQFIDRWIQFPAPSGDLVRPLVLAVVSLLPFIAALLTRGQPPRSTGWDHKRLRAGLQAGLAAALLTIFLRNRVMDVLGGLKPGEITYLGFALVIALAEETIFRGYIQLRLGWWMGETRGWIVTSILYALFRFPAYLSAGDLNHALFGLVIALGQGLVAGWLMRRSGHVLTSALYRAASIWMNVFL